MSGSRWESLLASLVWKCLGVLAVHVTSLIDIITDLQGQGLSVSPLEVEPQALSARESD